MSNTSASLLASAQQLCAAVAPLRFSAPVTHIYNPLDYAWAGHELYLKKYGQGRKRIIFLGMNPGPFGMAQTGVPFGEVAAVRDWLGITAPINKPAQENPKKPVDGFACTRAEVSGQRLWGLFAATFKTPEAFFAEHFVANYCPLLWLNGTKNVTPVELPKAETAPVDAACNAHLRQMVEILQPAWVIGVGKYARKQAETALRGYDLNFGDILHPSPASPAANKGWAPIAQKQLEDLGLWA
jgi:single-strand selective monofunctional uracil DNA glycosylase